MTAENAGADELLADASDASMRPRPMTAENTPTPGRAHRRS